MILHPQRGLAELLGEIGKNLRSFLEQEDGKATLRSILEEMADVIESNAPDGADTSWR